MSAFVGVGALAVVLRLALFVVLVLAAVGVGAIAGMVRADRVKEGRR